MNRHWPTTCCVTAGRVGSLKSTTVAWPEAISTSSKSVTSGAPEYAIAPLDPTSVTEWRSPSATKRSEEHTSELQSRGHLVCRLLLEKKTTARTERCIMALRPSPH